MALGPDFFNLTINFNSVFCYQGDDIDDWFDEESEPYLWVFGVKIDGEGFMQQGNLLVERPGLENTIYHCPPGNHGNIGGSILRGTRNIPANIGKWDTSLRPIPITAPVGLPGQQLTTIPGMILCYAVLMEENETDGDTIDRTHAAMLNLIKTTVRNIFGSLGLAGIAADIFAEITLAAAGGTPLSVEDATNKILNARLKPITDLFSLAAAGLGIQTILADLDLGDVPPDKVMGSFNRTFTQKELAQTTDSNKLTLTGYMWKMPEWAYTLHGFAFAHHKWVRAAPPESARLRVTCSSKRGLGPGRRIASIGGIDNNKFWSFYREEAVNLLLNHQKTFYVRGTNNNEIEVRAVHGGFWAGRPWYFLQTQADGVQDNNLMNLPACSGAEYVEVWY